MPPSSLEGVHAAYCALAAAIAKNNTLIRDRYPDTHALYLRCEKSYFGIFWDMPLPLHICMDAAETACRVSGEEHDALAMRLKEEIEQARRAVASRRHHLAKDATFRQHNTTQNDRLQGASFLRSCTGNQLPRPSRDACARHKRRCTVLADVKRDRNDFCRVLRCLRRRLPFELSNRVLCMAV